MKHFFDREAASHSRTASCWLGALLSLVTVLLLLVGAAASQSMAGQSSSEPPFEVTVADDSNQPVPAASVEVRQGTKVAASATTDDKGKARLSLRGIGEYQISVRKQGYIPIDLPLTLSAGAARTFEVMLPKAALSQQTVEVTAEAPNPVAEATPAGQTKLEVQQAKNAPGKPPTIADALPLVPGVIRAKDGSVHIAGLGENHSAMLVNSVNVTDPATGEFGMTIPIDSVETLSVSEMPYLAQYGKFTAGVITAETRKGDDKWRFDVNDPLPEFRIRSWHVNGLKSATPRVNLSGPLVKGKLYFLTGTEYLLQKQSVITLPYPQNQTKTSAINSFTQLDAVLSPRQMLSLSVHAAPHYSDYSGLNFFNPMWVTSNVDQRQYTGAVAHKLALGEGLLQSTFAVTRVSTTVVPQSYGDMILAPDGNTGSYFSSQSRQANRYEWIENWTPRKLHLLGDHTFQVGLSIARSEDNGYFEARTTTIEDASGNTVSTINFKGGSPYSVHDTEPAVYVQDHWALNSRFALDAGYRMEGQTISHSARSAPRGGFVWSPSESGNTVVRGGVGIFYDYVPLNTYAFSSYPEQEIDGVLYGNVTDEAARSSSLVHSGQVSGNFAPYSIAANIEVQRTVNRWLTMSVKYLHSNANNQLTLQQENGAMVLGSSGWAHTRQFEFTAKVGSSEKRRFFFSYVRQRAVGELSDASQYLGNNPYPVIRQDIVASMPSEIPNRFLLWGTYSLPRKIRLTPKVEFRNGFPFQPTDQTQQYVTVNGPQPRFPRYFSADMRVSKDIQVNAKHAIRLSGTIQNLTDHFNPLEVHSNINDPSYGTFFGNWGRKFMIDFDFLF